MLGLWGPSTTYGRDFHKSHLAFAVTLPELLVAGAKFCRSGVTCQDFRGKKTNEPSVIGWTPSAQLYFNDPDGHLVELIALLHDKPNPNFIGSLTEWRNKTS
jgi:lactoylglutathione lyase